MSDVWMPEFDPPWALEGIDVRPEYAEGLWSYAVGRPAAEHPQYGEAVDLFRADGLNPWWIRSWANVVAVLRGHRMDERRGGRVCKFLEKLSMSGEWEGDRMRLMDWQRYDLIMPLYGWVRTDGSREYVRAGVWISKKNGKSGLCSGIALYHLRSDGEEKPYIWLAAADLDQARIVYDESEKMAIDTPSLSKVLIPVSYRKTIMYPARHGTLRALCRTPKKQEGLNWSAGIFDEIHVGSEQLWKYLSGGNAVRRQPMLITISTAGEYNPVSLGWRQWDYGRQIQSGALENDSFFSLMYMAPADAQWDDMETVKIANPSLGVILREERIHERITEARVDVIERADFEQRHLNRWVNSARTWIDQAVWDQCGTMTDIAA